METCPECEKSFNSEHGLSTHYSMVHDKPEVECNECGSIFKTSITKEEDRKFCSRECYQKNESSRKSVDCYNCGKTFEVLSSRYENTKKQFCSSECYESPNWRRYSKKCHSCGEEMKITKSRKERTDKVFCSMSCRNKSYKGEGNPFYGKTHENLSEKMPSGEDHWSYGTTISEENKKKLSEQRKGKNNPMYGVRGSDAPAWEGGNPDSQSWRRTADWYEVREEAIKRDNKCCEDCGASEDLHVHHIKPVSEGGKKFDISNLITLCKEHHYDRHRK